MSLTAKLLEIQKEVKSIAVNAKNPHFKNTYLDLEGLQEAVLPLLNAHGILLYNNVVTETEGATLVTVLVDTEDNSTLKSFFPIEGNAQQMGGAITYGRRYNLSSLLAITVDKDDDGNSTAPAERAPRGEGRQRTNNRRGAVS